MRKRRAYVVRFRWYGRARYGIVCPLGDTEWQTRGETSDYMTREEARALARMWNTEENVDCFEDTAN